MFASNKALMEKITTKIVNKLINQAIKEGKSEPIEVDSKDISYFRVLLSNYNKVNKTKLSLRGLHGVYMEVYAPFDRFYDQTQYKPAFDIIQNVLTDPKYILTPDKFDAANKVLHELNRVLNKRLSDCQFVRQSNVILE